MVTGEVAMTKTAQEIAEEALPGWRAEKSRRSPASMPDVDGGTPDIATLRRKYLGEAAGDQVGLVPASGYRDDDTEYVVLHPVDGDASSSRVVVVSRGRAIAIQG